MAVRFCGQMQRDKTDKLCHNGEENTVDLSNTATLTKCQVH